MHTRNILYIVSLALITIALTLMCLPFAPVSAMANAAPAAQAGSAGDLIAAVNAYRSANGLEPYSTDGTLMSLAQGQAEYIAQIQSCTHSRADGSQPADHGISAENVACGDNLSISSAIYGQWADPLHSATILGPTSGMVGAGVSTNGSGVYYALAVKRLSGSFDYRPPVQQTTQGGEGQAVSQAETPAPPAVPNGIVTSTPNEDGSISHTIKYGEMLVDIAEAYGVSLQELIAINRLSPQNPVYYEGDVLLIRLASTATPVVTATSSPRPPTRTPLPTRTQKPTRTAAPPRTPLPTHTPSPTPWLEVPTLEDLGPARNVMAFTFIGISAVGLIVLIWSSFLPGKRG